MTHEDVEKYILIMKKHGVQNLQVENGSDKLIVSGLYEPVVPNAVPGALPEEVSRDSAMDAFRED